MRDLGSLKIKVGAGICCTLTQFIPLTKMMKFIFKLNKQAMKWTIKVR